jgi:hypothetical protein
MVEKLNLHALLKWTGLGLSSCAFVFLWYLALSIPEEEDGLRMVVLILPMMWSFVWYTSYFGAKLVTRFVGNLAWFLIAPFWALGTWKVSALVSFRPEIDPYLIVFVGLLLLASLVSGWAAALLVVQGDSRNN